MKASVQSFLIVLGIVFFGIVTPGQSKAQDEQIRESKSVNISTTEEGKVKLKVIMKKDNDETTFEKTYDSYEEMYEDPDLEKYGIDLGFGSGSNQFKFSQQSPQFFFHNGPKGSFWDEDDFQFDFESLREQMDDMMKDFGGQGFFFNDDSFMDVDSLMQQFQFRNDNGRFYFNGEEIMDIDSLKEAMKEQFDHFQFDFDFDDSEEGNYNLWYDQDDRVRVITRAKVYIRSAKEEDKELVGTEESAVLQLNDISFYPNPSDGRFELEIDAVDDAPIQLIIVDDQGQEVYNRTVSPVNGLFIKRIDLTQEGKGIYVLKVEQNGKSLTKRIIIE